MWIGSSFGTNNIFKASQLAASQRVLSWHPWHPLLRSQVKQVKPWVATSKSPKTYELLGGLNPSEKY